MIDFSSLLFFFCFHLQFWLFVDEASSVSLLRLSIVNAAFIFNFLSILAEHSPASNTVSSDQSIIMASSGNKNINAKLVSFSLLGFIYPSNDDREFKRIMIRWFLFPIWGNFEPNFLIRNLIVSEIACFKTRVWSKNCRFLGLSDLV